MSIQLGDTVRDKITGLVGIAVAETRWLHGCLRIGLQSPELHEGKPIDVQWLDAPQLEVLPKESLVAADPDRSTSQGTTGGPMPDPSGRRREDSRHGEGRRS